MDFVLKISVVSGSRVSIRTRAYVRARVGTCTTTINLHGIRPGRYMRDYLYLYYWPRMRVCVHAFVRSACMHACVRACERACVRTYVPYASHSATTHRQFSPA